MNSAFTYNYELLMSLISELESEINSFVTRPGIDFSRKRKISFQDTILFLLTMRGGSLNTAFFDFFSCRSQKDLPSLSALQQQRAKIHPDAFYHLLHRFSRSLPSEHDYEGFQLLACDGSDLNIFYNPDDKDSCKHVFAHIMAKGLSFVIRTKDIFSKGGISRGFRLPDRELDEELDFFITRSTVHSKRDPIRYKKLSPRSAFDFLNLEKDGKQAVYPMHLRLVRFQLDTGEYECIVTNLGKDRFPPEKIKELYHLRWGIETSFRKLKYNIGVSNLHSKKAEYVEQEIYARIIMYNFCESVTAHVTVKQKDQKYVYQINFTMAVHICKIFLQKSCSTIPPHIETLLLQYLTPVRPGRKFPRSKKMKGFVAFGYRVS